MRQDASGNYIVEGRKKDLINRGGEKISAEEVENLILSHPAVHNVACIPMPDPILGERMCAGVTLRTESALTFEELVGFLAAKGIARHKLPERLEVFSELPVSTFGKIAKKTLAELVGRRMPQGAPRGGASRNGCPRRRRGGPGPPRAVRHQTPAPAPAVHERVRGQDARYPPRQGDPGMGIRGS